MSNYEYSFKPKKRIMHCEECQIRYISTFGNVVCGFDEDGEIGIECSDITRPDNCPLEENEIKEFYEFHFSFTGLALGGEMIVVAANEEDAKHGYLYGLNKYKYNLGNPREKYSISKCDKVPYQLTDRSYYIAYFWDGDY